MCARTAPDKSYEKMSKENYEAFTVQGRDTPVPVGVPGGRVGPARPSSSHNTASVVGDQAMTQAKATGHKGEEGAFLRSKKTMRSPLVKKAGLEKEQAQKTPGNKEIVEETRKAATSTPTEVTDRFEDEMEDMLETSMDIFDEIILGNPLKRKRGEEGSINVSMSSDRYASLMEMLVEIKKDLLYLREKNASEEEKGILVDNIIKKIENEEKATHKAIIPSVQTDIGIQCNIEDIERENEAQNILNLLKEHMEQEEIVKVVNLEWPEVIYTTQINAGSIASAKVEGGIVIIAPTKEMKDLKLLKLLLGGAKRMMKHIKKGGLNEGEVILHRTDGCVMTGDKAITDTNYVCFGTTVDSEDFNSQIQSLYDVCTRVKDRMIIEEDREIHVAIFGKLKPEVKRKIVECAMRDMRGKVILHERVERGQDRKRVHRTDAVIVEKTPGKTYAEMVQELKKEFTKDKACEDIRGVRQTREGHMLLEMKKDSVETDNVLKKVRAVMGSEKVKKFTSKSTKKAVNIYGLDMDLNELQVESALKKVINAPSEYKELEVKALRPMYGGRKTATIVAPPEIVKKLINTHRIRIGLSIVEVKERTEVIRCNRCWEMGHVAKDCIGEDRMGKCGNCGKDGHTVRECTENPFCLKCLKEGHRTTSGRCRGEKPSKS